FSRSRVTPRSAATANPYRAAGKLFFTEPGVGDFQCSASIIKNRVIVTAAHCLFDPVAKSFFTNWVFIPAYDGFLSNPAGSETSPQSPFGPWCFQFVIVSGHDRLHAQPRRVGDPPTESLRHLGLSICHRVGDLEQHQRLAAQQRRLRTHRASGHEPLP